MRSLAASPFKAQSQQNHFNRVDTGRHSDYQLTSNSVAGHFSFVQYAAIALINKANLLVLPLTWRRLMIITYCQLIIILASM